MTTITIDNHTDLGPLELWRHSVGHGGINTAPLPDRVIQGTAKLQPRLIRIFIQEFFTLYPDHDRFDWHKLDPYMDALARTGAKVVAAITIKPKVLYPVVDHNIWRPNNIPEWQHVIRELVLRYSVAKPVVTHWEIGNEVDIGESGGCPYRIQDPQAYGEYYTMTVLPIREVFPEAKVGGPASASMHAEPLPGFLAFCRQTQVPIDFVSWHLYHSDPDLHSYQVDIARLLTADLPQKPELLVTEWSPFPSAWNREENADSVEDRAFDPRRAAAIAASVIKMRRAGLDGSFYYHLWDQVCNADDFSPFFSAQGTENMVHHWNEFPHRLGLFGVNAEVRPQYFVYLLFSRLGEQEVPAHSNDVAVHTIAGRDEHAVRVLAVNHSLDEQRDRVVTVRFTNLKPGMKDLKVYRIDRSRQWDTANLELIPVEQRATSTQQTYACQIWLPANSVAMVSLHNPPSNAI